MHFHHYTLVRLGEFLLDRFKGGCIQAAFSQNRNELIIEIEGIYLRIGCHTPHTYVVPVYVHSKARKNVVDLFEPAYQLQLTNVRTVPYERILILELENGYDFVLKMHGLRANVLLRRNGEVIELFNNQQESDWEFQEAAGPYNPDATQVESPVDEKEVRQSLKKISLIYEKYFAARVFSKIQKGNSFKKGFEKVKEESLDEHYFLVKEKDRIKFYMFPPDAAADSFLQSGIDEALRQWLKFTFQFDSYRFQFKSVEKEISKPYKKYKKVYESYLKNIEQLETERSPEEIGHLLMANLHNIPPNQKKVKLHDFYLDQEIDVKLDPLLNPQENAKKYYDKHKMRRSRLAYLKEQLEDIENKLLQAEEDYEEFHRLSFPEKLSFNQDGFLFQELKSMKQFYRRFKKELKEAEEDRSPFRHYKRSGFEIFVGKNARNNDELSFKFANKNDTWLHAKDVTGSHVIIRHKAGKDLPIEVLEFAAQLAAFYSKRKNDTLVPVQYTPRKYIRKRKGDPPGMVAVDREKVIMVEPVRE
ncbi:MAG: NFACT RNA binding domain-containing protein [Bacteroidia bacterium]|nr:NFACT RNA binding domain-containing protein [Bacteroidia bacterium]